MRGVRAQVQSGLSRALALMVAALLCAPTTAAPAAAGLATHLQSGERTVQSSGGHIRLAAEETPPLPPRPKPTPKGSIKTSGVRLTARLAEDAAAVETGVSWRITRYDGQGEPVESRESRPEIELPPGVYRVHAAVGAVEAGSVFAVKFDEVSQVSVPLGAGAVEVAVVADAAPMALAQARIRVRRAGTADGEPLLEVSGGHLQAVLPEGDYQIEADLGTASGHAAVSVATGSVTQAEIDLVVGFIIAQAVAAEGTEPLSSATFSLWEEARDAGDGDAIARMSGRNGIFTVAPGQYRLAAEIGLASRDQLVRVNANRLTTVTVTLDAARLELDAISPDSGAGLGAGAPARYAIFRAGADGGIDPIADLESALPVLRLPAGEYTVQAERDGLIARETVVLTAGRANLLRLVLGAGTAQVTATALGRSLEDAEIRLSAVPLTDAGVETGPAFDLGQLSSRPIVLPAGRYRLQGRLEPGGARAETALTLAAGARQIASLEFEIGTARLQVLSKSGGKPVAGAHVILRPALGGEATKLIGGDLEVGLAPGTYTVTAGSGTRTAEGELTIVAGNTATLELVPK